METFHLNYPTIGFHYHIQKLEPPLSFTFGVKGWDTCTYTPEKHEPHVLSHLINCLYMSGHKSNYNFAMHCYLQKRSTALFWFQSQLWMSLLSCKCLQRREKDLLMFILHIKLKYGCYPPLFAGMQVIFFCFIPGDFHRVYVHNKLVPSIVNSCRLYRFFLYLKRYIGRAVYWKIVFPTACSINFFLLCQRTIVVSSLVCINIDCFVVIFCHNLVSGKSLQNLLPVNP